MAEYELWLTDDAGRRLLIFDKEAYFSYTRAVRGYGTLNVGIPLEIISKQINPVFRQDRRVDVYRSPGVGFPQLREGSYLLRKFRIYEREDGIRMIEFFGRSPIDLLRRRSIYDPTKSSRTLPIDDMMKQIVRDTMPFSTAPAGESFPQGEFFVELNTSLGPTISYSFLNQNVLDILQNLDAASVARNILSASDRKIYFHVNEINNFPPGGFGYAFRTVADRRGSDRTLGTIFSVENGNLKLPDYSEDYLDEQNYFRVVCADQSIAIATDPIAAGQSRWALSIHSQISSSSDTATEGQETAYKLLHNRLGQKTIYATFLDSPGSQFTPRSLYRVDWDLGDLLPVTVFGKGIQVEVVIVYVSVNEKGEENVFGRNSVQ